MHGYFTLLGCLFACGAPEHTPDTVAPRALDVVLDRTLDWPCGNARDRWRVASDGSFVWIARHNEETWERVDGRWSIEREGPLSTTIAVIGTRTEQRRGARQPTQEPWEGVLTLASVSSIPRGAFIEESIAWTKACALPQTSPHELWENAKQAHAIAVTGGIEGVFAPVSNF